MTRVDGVVQGVDGRLRHWWRVLVRVDGQSVVAYALIRDWPSPPRAGVSVTCAVLGEGRVVLLPETYVPVRGVPLLDDVYRVGEVYVSSLAGPRPIPPREPATFLKRTWVRDEHGRYVTG